MYMFLQKKQAFMLFPTLFFAKKRKRDILNIVILLPIEEQMADLLPPTTETTPSPAPVTPTVQAPVAPVPE